MYNMQEANDEYFHLQKRLLRYTKVNRSMKSQDCSITPHLRASSYEQQAERPNAFFSDSLDLSELASVSKETDRHSNQKLKDIKRGDSDKIDESEATVEGGNGMGQQSSICSVHIDRTGISDSNFGSISEAYTPDRCTGYTTTAGVQISFELSEDQGGTNNSIPRHAFVGGGNRRIHSLGESKSMGPSFFSRSAESYACGGAGSGNSLSRAHSGSTGLNGATGKSSSRKFKYCFREDSTEAGNPSWTNFRRTIDEERPSKRMAGGDGNSVERRNPRK